VKGIAGHLPRKRSFLTDMAPLNVPPRKGTGLPGNQKRRKRRLRGQA
jgi:hypothetical protein